MQELRQVKRSPTAIVSEYLRSQGYLVDTCERWLPGVNIRKDLFGFADLVAVHPSLRETMLVQVTSASNAAARRTKISESDFARQIRAAGLEIAVYSTRKNGSIIISDLDTFGADGAEWTTHDI